MSLHSVDVFRGIFLYLLQLIRRVAFFSFMLNARTRHKIVSAKHFLAVDHLALIAAGVQTRVRRLG